MSVGGVSPVRVQAVHVGGVRSLPANRAHLELRFSDTGLDIFDREERRLVGRLNWSEITAVELARRPIVKRKAPQLNITTHAGRAIFSLPGLTRGQVEDHLQAVLRKNKR